jgi:hypothetical protein
MVVIADDEGRLRGNPEHLKSRIFGYKNFRVGDIRKWRDEAAEKLKRSVWIYEVDGEEYIQLTKWGKYQHLRKDRITPSIYPCGGPRPTSTPTSMSASMSAFTAAEDKRREIKLSKAKGRQGKCEGKGNPLPPGGGRGLEDLRKTAVGLRGKKL